jgi:hypothetical protein
LARVHRSLDEVKHANFDAKLTSNHCILATTINARPTLLVRKIAKVLRLHRRNMAIAMERCKMLSDLMTQCCGHFHFERKEMMGV